jgi:hypothetical protein
MNSVGSAARYAILSGGEDGTVELGEAKETVAIVGSMLNGVAAGKTACENSAKE